LLSQCISACQTGSDATQVVRSKLYAISCQLFADDSVNELKEIHVYVQTVEPGSEGALLEIRRLS